MRFWAGPLMVGIVVGGASLAVRAPDPLPLLTVMATGVVAYAIGYWDRP